MAGPRSEDTINTLSGARYFCSLDLALGYWHVEMSPQSREKNGICDTRRLNRIYGQFTFGLCNVPAVRTFMDKFLGGLLWDRCMCYLDDIIVYDNSFFKTLANLELVFQRVLSSGLRLKPSKCEQELLYLGFLINADGVRSDPAKIEVVHNWPIPCSLTDVRAFPGFATSIQSTLRWLDAWSGYCPTPTLTHRVLLFWILTLV